MSELSSVVGKVLLDRQVMIQLLAFLEERKLGETSTLYHIGFERAKADALQIISRSLGPDHSASTAVKLIRELRIDKGS